MKLTRVRGTLVAMPPKRSTKQGGGKDGDTAVDVTEIELGLDLGGEGDVDESFTKAIKELFGPEVTTQMKRAAKKTDADEVEGGGGFDITTRQKMGDLAVTIHGKYEGGKPIVTPIMSATVRSKAKLKVDAKGNATLVLRRVAIRVPFDEVPALFPYLNATVFVTCEAAQIDMSELDEAEGKAA